LLCKNPYMKGLIPCGCGQCVSCRINRRRMWANRLMLERQSHEFASFVTLTYEDANVEDVTGSEWTANRPVVGNLVYNHPRNFIKRLRKYCSSVDPKWKIRYFLVGEYGDTTQRPHYHVALFGFPNCLNGQTNHLQKECCQVCAVVQRVWNHGGVDIGELNQHSAQYIAGYVTKKWTKEDTWTKQKLKGRRPEFCRMSLKPGIGADAIKTLVTSGVSNQRKAQYLLQSLDAPAVLKIGGSPKPLGRYLRRKWREAIGRDPDTPKQLIQEFVSQLYRENAEAKKVSARSGVPSPFLDARSIYFEKNKSKIESLEKRTKIFQTRGTL